MIQKSVKGHLHQFSVGTLFFYSVNLNDCVQFIEPAYIYEICMDQARSRYYDRDIHGSHQAASPAVHFESTDISLQLKSRGKTGLHVEKQHLDHSFIRMSYCRHFNSITV